MGMELPEFREADGRFDWRQMLDMVIPGDVYNSRTNQWRPVGMAAGAATMLGGPLAGAAVEGGAWLSNNRPTMPNFRNPFSGMSNPFAGRERRVREYRGDLGPTRMGPSNYTGPSSFGEQDTFGTRDPNAVADISQGQVPGFRMQGFQQQQRPLGRGYDGQSVLSARLGGSQRRDADSIMAEQMALLERMRGRNGALMEQ